ncbi:hypothetical protein DXG03_003039 [Asterophora parasitica]|uniref:Uncharacterized protein n=1 Tax=Asterophora parasitica TaxID=117018 RepID=A0A9P7G7R6_9AGAR|nr:hypothetical protein DXG03_003039 [Asterophora parasitica]
MDEASAYFGFATGGLAVLGSLTSAIFYYYNYFPNAQMDSLEKTYRQTHAYYEEVRGEGMLPDAYAQQVEIDLKKLEGAVLSLRDTAYKCNSLCQEFLAFVGGLSRTIGKVLNQVGDLKSKIAQLMIRNLPLYMGTLCHPFKALSYP